VPYGNDSLTAIGLACEYAENNRRLNYSQIQPGNGGFMIRNSTLQKWHRLQQKQLNQQFLNEMIRGLECSPFEAKAVLNAVYQVYTPYFETSPTIKPGQILYQVISCETSPKAHLDESSQVTVTLTLDAGEKDLLIRRQQGVVGLRRHRLERVCNEAFQQGGLLTVEDVAIRLFNCGERTLSRDIAALNSQGIVLPLRSVIKDMGRTLSHRSLIVREWLSGREYSSIGVVTCHSIQSVKNYVSKFKRVVALARDGHEFRTIAFLVRLSYPLVQDYYNLWQTCDIVPHRRQELDDLSKKTESFPAPAGRCP
jgi:hypothetical protein